MNTLKIKAECNIVTGKLKQAGPKLTDDQPQYVEGKSQELFGKAQKETGGNS